MQWLRAYYQVHIVCGWISQGGKIQLEPFVQSSTFGGVLCQLMAAQNINSLYIKIHTSQALDAESYFDKLFPSLFYVHF